MSSYSVIRCNSTSKANNRRGEQLCEVARVAADSVGTGGLTGRGGGALYDDDLRRVAQQLEAAFGDQLLVDGAEAPFEGGEDRRAERDGLAVHRAAGADDEVGVGDQRLRVDRTLGDREAAGRVELGTLLGGPR